MGAFRLALLLAARNLRRHLRRSLVTATTIALGVAMMLFSIAVAEGSYDSLVDAAARSGSGHVVVRAPSDDPLDPEPLPDPNAVVRAVDALGVPARAAPRAEALVLATAAGGSATVKVLGVDPGRERGASVLPESLVEGGWLPDEPTRVPRVLLGRGVARRLGAKLGDRVVLMGQSGGDVESLLARVCGIFATNSPDVDDALAVVRLDVAARLAGDEDAVHLVGVVLEDGRDAREAADALALALPGLQVRTWAEEIPQLGDLVAMDRRSGDVSFFLVFAIVSLAVLNAVLMSVMERVREFGVMLAVGMRPGTLFQVVLLEGLLLALVSAAAGGMLALALVGWLHRTGIDVAALFGIENMDAGGYSLSGRIYPFLPAARTLGSLAMVVLLTVAASVYPAWKAARIAPVEAIRHA